MMELQYPTINQDNSEYMSFGLLNFYRKSSFKGPAQYYSDAHFLGVL